MVEEVREEGRREGVRSGLSYVRSVNEEATQEIEGRLARPMGNELLPGASLNTGKDEFAVLRVHLLNLFQSGGAQNLDDLHQLINAGVAREEWTAQQEFTDDTASRPHVNADSVLGGTKDQFWCSVVAGTDVGDVGFARHENLSTAEVADLEDARLRIDQQVLWLNIAVANVPVVDVGQSANQLEAVQFYVEYRY